MKLTGDNISLFYLIYFVILSDIVGVGAAKGIAYFFTVFSYAYAVFPVKGDAFRGRIRSPGKCRK